MKLDLNAVLATGGAAATNARERATLEARAQERSFGEAISDARRTAERSQTARADLMQQPARTPERQPQREPMRQPAERASGADRAAEQRARNARTEANRSAERAANDDAQAAARRASVSGSAASRADEASRRSARPAQDNGQAAAQASNQAAGQDKAANEANAASAGSDDAPGALPTNDAGATPAVTSPLTATARVAVLLASQDAASGSADADPEAADALASAQATQTVDGELVSGAGLDGTGRHGKAAEASGTGKEVAKALAEGRGQQASDSSDAASRIGKHSVEARGLNGPGETASASQTAGPRPEAGQTFAMPGMQPHVAAQSPSAAQPTPTPQMPASPQFGQVSTPVGHPTFADSFASEVASLTLSGVGRAEISVQPPELGPVRIELSLNGDQARVAIAATQADTRQAIEQSLSTLRDMLASQGLTLTGADVSDGRAHARHGNAAAHNPSGSGRGGEGASGNDGGDGSGDRANRPVARAINALVDLYA